MRSDLGRIEFGWGPPQQVFQPYFANLIDQYLTLDQFGQRRDFSGDHARGVALFENGRDLCAGGGRQGQ